MFDFIVRLVSTVLCLGLVVVIHEFGHFLVARLLGVRVERFTVGFGPEIFGFTKGSTRYALCAVPLGGMVKLAGEFMDERKSAPDEFFSQPWYNRIAIALAGPAMNYLLAFVLFAFVAGVWGTMQPAKDPVIGELVPGLPAAEAKLQKGDRVLSIDGQSISVWDDMAKIIHGKADQKVELMIERTDMGETKPHTMKIALTPKKDPQQNIGLIGVVPNMDRVSVGFVGSLKNGWRDVKHWTTQPLVYISHKLSHWEGPKELSGPIGIAHMVTKATKEGIAYVIYLIAIISTGLGLFNLFPIPILDGGHVLLHGIEGAMRRPLSKKAMQLANTIGLSIVLCIFLYASYQDIVRWRGGFWR